MTTLTTPDLIGRVQGRLRLAKGRSERLTKELGRASREERALRNALRELERKRAPRQTRTRGPAA